MSPVWAESQGGELAQAVTCASYSRMTRFCSAITASAVVPGANCRARSCRQAAGTGAGTWISTIRGGDTTGALEQAQRVARQRNAQAVEARVIEAAPECGHVCLPLGADLARDACDQALDPLIPRQQFGVGSSLARSGVRLTGCGGGSEGSLEVRQRGFGMVLRGLRAGYLASGPEGAALEADSTTSKERDDRHAREPWAEVLPEGEGFCDHTPVSFSESGSGRFSFGKPCPFMRSTKNTADRICRA